MRCDGSLFILLKEKNSMSTRERILTVGFSITAALLVITMVAMISFAGTTSQNLEMIKANQSRIETRFAPTASPVVRATSTITATMTIVATQVVDKRCLAEMKIKGVAIDLYEFPSTESVKLRAPDVAHPSDYPIALINIVGHSQDFQMFRVIVMFKPESGATVSGEGWVRVGSIVPKGGVVGQYCSDIHLYWNTRWFHQGDDEIFCQMAVIAIDNVSFSRLEKTDTGSKIVQASYFSNAGHQYQYFDTATLNGTNWIRLGAAGEFYVLPNEVYVGPHC